ncbi:MAG: hypothetical protein M3253_09105, partial [Chloroflexota bacterium]|nr:hypothetical protein [Chloroflexota bacterium]
MAQGGGLAAPEREREDVRMHTSVRSAASLLSLVLALSLMPASSAALAADQTTYYFHGTAADQANKNLVLVDATARGTATFNQTAPTEAVPDTQTTTPVANQDFVGNPLTAYWNGAVAPSTLSGAIQLRWFWSSANPAALAGGSQVTVTVFANPQYVASRVQPDRIIGRAVVSLATGATPTENVSLIPINSGQTVVSELLIQAAANSLVSGEELKVHYDAVSAPSGFQVVDFTPPPTPTVAFDTETRLEFAPPTIVSAHFFGAEPMTALERPVPGSRTGAVDRDRIFVDWPLSTRSQIGQLSRSTDGGDSFRLLYDLSCAPRSRPMCTTGGGGDTDTEVNLVTGTVLFSDQVGLANEALASSIDHGDTFPLERQFGITNATTVTDRQWLTSIDPSLASVAGRPIEGFLAYHLPAAGQYIQGIDVAGVPIPQAVPQILEVAQSGPIRADSTAGPARGWIWQPYRNAGGYMIATARAANYTDPAAWRSNHVSADQPAIFPWLQLDARGNAFAVWVTSGIIYLSISPIDDPRNDPGAGGWPGTFWSEKVRVTPPEIRSAVFPVVTAGDAGRVAVAYMGSEDCTSGPPIV